MFGNIGKLLESITLNKRDYRIILVSNVRGKTTNFIDYSGVSVTSEFLTPNQYELIVGTLKESGFDVFGYFDENLFLEDCIEQNYFRDTGKQVIVISMAQKGTAIGRKSLIPAFCDLNGLWHTNSNAYVVSLTRDKFHCDSILKANALPTANSYLYLPNSGWFLGQKPNLGEQVIAKLNGEASSIGMSKDNIFLYENKHDDFIDKLSKTYRQPVVVQTFIKGYEVEVPVVTKGNISEVVLPVGIAISNQKYLGDSILDYDSRLNSNYCFYNFQEFDSDMSNKLNICAKHVIKLFGIDGFGRVDFRIDRDGNYYITDVATNPRLAKSTSFCYAYEINGFTFKDMIETLIAVTILRYERR